MKKIYCLIIIILTLTSLYAQNLPTIDYNRWHYGAFVGINIMDFGIKANPSSEFQPEIRTFIPGFSVGLIGEMRLNNYFNLRLAPAFHMGQYNVVFDTINNVAKGVSNVTKDMQNAKFLFILLNIII